MAVSNGAEADHDIRCTGQILRTWTKFAKLGHRKLIKDSSQ
jgi:hypothetical protein